MKIALVFWGLTRSLTRTYPNIKEKILDNLKAYKIDYKIFLHTYYFEGKHNDRRTGEINVTLDFNEYKILNPDFFQIDNQDEIKKNINIKQYMVYKYYYNSKTIENLICALYSQMKAYELVENSGINFDYVWFLRPDVIFKSKLPIRWLRWINPNRFLVPAFAHFKGINDRMAILTMSQAKIYSTRFHLIHDYGKELKGKKIASEIFLKWVMKNYKIKEINYLFKRLRSNGNFNYLDVKLF